MSAVGPAPEEHRWLDAMAAFYDLDLKGHDEDIAFWINLADYCAGPALEVGCGTGRVALALAGAGIEVTGVDVSAAMLERASGTALRLGHPPVFIQADVRTLDLGRRFDLIAVPLGGFCHLLTAEDQLAALGAMARHLGGGGLLVLDLPFLGPDEWRRAAPSVRQWRRRDDAGRWVTKYAGAVVDFAQQMQRLTYRYEVEGDGETSFSFDLRHVFPAEAEHLLARAGLELEHRYGGYDLEPFTADSYRMLIVARDET